MLFNNKKNKLCPIALRFIDGQSTIDNRKSDGKSKNRQFGVSGQSTWIYIYIMLVCWLQS